METIEKVPSEGSAYKNLFEIGDYVGNSQNMDIEDIILNVCSKDRELQLGRKVAYLDSRFISQNMQNATSEHKAAVLRETGGIFLQGASAACQIASIFLPGAKLPGVMQTFSKAFEVGGGYKDKFVSTEGDLLGHVYQRQGTIERDFSQQIQSTDKEHDQDVSMIDRLIQASRRTAELVVGS